MPARMSGLSIRCPYSCAGPLTTTRCGSHRMIRAPIDTSLSVKKSRLSNIFPNLRAEGDEKTAQVLHVRLACGVADHRLAGGQDRCHDGVLRRHDAGLVEEDVVAAQPPACAHLETAPELDLRPELRERMDVRVEPSPADDVAAGRRHAHCAETRQQRSREEE